LILLPSIYYLITSFYEKLIIGLLYMPGLEIQSTGEIVATYNGDVVENAKWNMDYDGKTMDIETLRNNELAIIQLDNNDLSRLLQGIGMHRENGLEERLNRDFRQGSVQGSAPARRSKCSRQGSSHARRSSPKRSSPKRSSPKRSSPKTKRVRFMDDNLRKSGKQKHKIIIRKQGSRQGSAPARRSKRRRGSPKRSSPNRSSPNRSSPKRSSPKRSSPRSNKRGSPKGKRSSPKSSPKSSSPRSKKKSSNKKTRKKIIVQEGEGEGEGENMDLDLDVDFDYDFNSRPDIEKTIY
jgi:hypothetical protein